MKQKDEMELLSLTELEENRLLNREKARRWRERNKDKVKEKSRAYTEANREKLRQKAREYYQANKEELKAKQRARSEDGKRRAYNQEYYRKNREKLREYSRDYHRDGNGFEQRLLREFEITKAQRDQLLKEQGGGCAICDRKDGEGFNRLNVDHCRQTGKVRGLLCGTCNRGIGSLRDDPVLLRKALEYLKSSL